MNPIPSKGYTVRSLEFNADQNGKAAKLFITPSRRFIRQSIHEADEQHPFDSIDLELATLRELRKMKIPPDSHSLSEEDADWLKDFDKQVAVDGTSYIRTYYSVTELNGHQAVIVKAKYSREDLIKSP